MKNQDLSENKIEEIFRNNKITLGDLHDISLFTTLKMEPVSTNLKGTNNLISTHKAYIENPKEQTCADARNQSAQPQKEKQKSNLKIQFRSTSNLPVQSPPVEPSTHQNA